MQSTQFFSGSLRAIVILTLSLNSTPGMSEQTDQNFENPQEPEHKIVKVDHLHVHAPSDWKVNKESSSQSIITEKVANMKYQKSMNIESFEGEKVIDEDFAKVGLEIIKDQFSELDGVENYESEEAELITLSDGRPAMLVYSVFNLDEIPMMHMHVFTSEANRYYRMTYSDLYENLSKEDSSSLQLAWDMVSQAFITPGPVKSTPLISSKFAITSSGTIAIMFLVGYTRKSYLRQLTKAIESDVALQQEQANSTWVLKQVSKDSGCIELDDFGPDEELYIVEELADDDLKDNLQKDELAEDELGDDYLTDYDIDEAQGDENFAEVENIIPPQPPESLGGTLRKSA